ncbi:MAG: hypothetical protein P8X79_16825 [Reinekea sp.]
MESRIQVKYLLAFIQKERSADIRSVRWIRAYQFNERHPPDHS